MTNIDVTLDYETHQLAMAILTAFVSEAADEPPDGLAKNCMAMTAQLISSDLQGRDHTEAIRRLVGLCAALANLAMYGIHAGYQHGRTEALSDGAEAARLPDMDVVLPVISEAMRAIVGKGD